MILLNYYTEAINLPLIIPPPAGSTVLIILND